MTEKALVVPKKSDGRFVTTSSTDCRCLLGLKNNGIFLRHIANTGSQGKAADANRFLGEQPESVSKREALTGKNGFGLFLDGFVQTKADASIGHRCTSQEKEYDDYRKARRSEKEQRAFTVKRRGMTMPRAYPSPYGCRFQAPGTPVPECRTRCRRACCRPKGRT